jgi:hypothetical protein
VVGRGWDVITKVRHSPFLFVAVWDIGIGHRDRDMVKMLCDLPSLQVWMNHLLPRLINTHLLLVNSTLCRLLYCRTPTRSDVIHQITGGAFVAGVAPDRFATTLSAKTSKALDSLAIDVLNSDLGAEVCIDPRCPFALLLHCAYA